MIVLEGAEGGAKVGDRMRPIVDAARAAEAMVLEGGQRLVEPEALREGARDLVEGAQAARRLPLGRERGFPLAAQLRRLLVELRILHGHRELPSQRAEQSGFVFGRGNVPPIVLLRR